MQGLKAFSCTRIETKPYNDVCFVHCIGTGMVLLPIFYLNVLQATVRFLNFLVQLAFLATLLWIFKPAEDSPYLMIGNTLEDTDALGMGHLDTALGVSDDEEGGWENARGTPGDSSSNRAPAVELGGAAIRKQQWQQQQQRQGDQQGRDQGDGVGAAAAAAVNGGADLPSSRKVSEVMAPPGHLQIKTHETGELVGLGQGGS